MNTTLKTIFWWMVIFVLVIVLWNAFQAGKVPAEELTFGQFMDLVEARHVVEVTIQGQEVTGTLREAAGYGPEAEFTAIVPDYPDLAKELREAGVEVKAKPPRDGAFFTTMLMWAPFLIIIGLWIFFMRQMQSGGNRALSFGKSRARLLSATGKKVTFQDVAGVEEAKEELWEIVEFLKEPQKFQKLGGKIPKGVLLMGSPGTGKTLLARAIAGEANVPFFSISGSDFVEMFVGVGASRVRDLFEQGKKNAPCIIFIDEIDAVGRHRGAGLGGGHDEREQTLNQLLVEMDGFETNEGVILIAATNRADVLDPALLRPGRFDRRVIVDRPDLNGRLGILKVHTRNIPISENVELEVVARGTPGFSGADLANLVNEAALVAARRDKKMVTMEDFEHAKDKVIMGVERKTMVLTDEEKQVTAFHEAGHALVAAFSPASDPLHKVTIIPRGRALGLTMQLPTEDKYTYKKSYVEDQIAILMGGRMAEELTQNEITTGAGNDIERATELARRMVCEWGMSELGPLSYGEKDEPVFLGREFASRAVYSESTAQQIDTQIKEIVDRGYQKAREILTEHQQVLDRLAQDLLEKESLDGRAVYQLIEEMTGQVLGPRPRERTKPPPGSDADDEPAKEPSAEEVAEDEPRVGAEPGIVTARMASSINPCTSTGPSGFSGPPSGGPGTGAGPGSRREG